jgi:molybdopterin-guanine dinucleotide biosynthesis protein A
MISDVSAYILAGGGSSRFGSNKALHVRDGVAFIQRIADTVKTVIPRVSIVANDPETYAFLGLPVIPDIVQGFGPVGGIQAALTHAASDYIFIVACDMPDISPDIIRFMISLCEGGEYDVIVPCRDGNHEPLHAIYRRSCLAHVENLVRENRRRIIGIFPLLSVRRISHEEIASIADPSRVFHNINTPEDLG